MAKQDRFASKAKSVLTARSVQYPQSVSGSCLTNDEIKNLVSEAQSLANEKCGGVTIITGDRRAASVLKQKGISAFFIDDARFRSQRLFFVDHSQESH